jgi:hypothetical protein
VTAVSSTSVTINSDLFSGSGTFTSWNLTIAGERGAVGATGPTGPVAGSANQVVYKNSSNVAAGSNEFIFTGTNVGIGTTSPSTKLDVNGSVAIGVATSGTNLTIYNGTTDNQHISIGMSSTNAYFNATRVGGTVPNILYQIDGTERMRIASDGNVGIGTGTTAPSNLLQTRRNPVGDTAVVVSNNGTPNANTTMSFILQEDATPQGWFRRYRDGSGRTEIGYSDILTFSSGITGTKAERMRITSGGFVGIGITNPDGRLVVQTNASNTRNIEARDETNSSSITLIPRLGAGGYNPMSIADDVAIIFSTDGNPDSTADRGLLIAPHNNVLGNAGIRIKENGNVGIGAPNPQTKLEVSADLTETARFSYSVAPTSYYLRVRQTNPVSAVVAWNFDVRNNDSQFDNTLVLDRGNVGIGTATPQTKLQVSGSADTFIKVSSTTNDVFRGIGFGNQADTNLYGTVSMQLTSGEMKHVAGFSGWGGYQTFHTNGSQRMVIASNGRVGIGTGNPQAILHISGTAGTWDAGIQIEGTGTGARRYGAYVTSSGTLTLADENAGLDRLSITAAGFVGIGVLSPASKLHIIGNTQTNGAFITVNPNNDQKYALLDYEDDIDALSIRALHNNVAWKNVIINRYAGNVGIGTTNPSQKLDVNGNINLGGTSNIIMEGNTNKKTAKFEFSSGTLTITVS